MIGYPCFPKTVDMSVEQHFIINIGQASYSQTANVQHKTFIGINVNQQLGQFSLHVLVLQGVVAYPC